MATLAIALSRAAETIGPALAEYAARAALVLAAAWTATAVMRRASAAARHLVWSLAVVAVLALPALSLVPGWRILPAWRSAANEATPAAPLSPRIADPALPVRNPTAPATGLPPAPQGAARPTETLARVAAPAWRPSAAEWLLLSWCAGAAAALLPMALGRLSLLRLERGAAPVRDAAWLRSLQQARGELALRRPVRLLLSAARTMPMTWGLARPRILLPADADRWPAERRRIVLLHELAHVKRWDCLTHLLAQLARALNWFNPLAWLAAHRLQSERERACDDLVLRLGAPPPDYAHQLVEVAAGLRLGARGAAAMAMARPSALEGRVREILDTKRNRAGVTVRATIAAAAVMAAFAVTLASLKSATASAKEAPIVAPTQPSDWSDELKAAMERMRGIQWAVWNYAAEHENRWPPDLGVTLPYMRKPGEKLSGAEKARRYLSPRDEAVKQVPEEPTPEWVNQNTSYVYLGVPDWSSETAYPDATYTVWLHESLERGYSAGPGKPEAFPLAMVNSGVVPCDWTFAQWLVATSKMTWEAFRTGAPLPAHQQASLDARTIMRALKDYAAAHDGVMPPDLGSALPYVPTERRTSTLADKAAVFLAPHRKQTMLVPEAPTAEWVNGNTSYIYLAGGIQRRHVPDPMTTLLFYGDPAEAVRVMWPGGREQQVTPFATAHGHVGVIGTDGQTDLASVAAHSKLILDLVRSAGPLPAYEHELRDLRILVQAVRAYADANNGVLPSTLGPTIPYIPAEDCPTPAEVARAYLSPVAERAVAIPGEPTPDWVNQNASYRYLGGPGLILRKVTPRALIILHGDPEEPFDRVWFGGVGKVIPSAGLRGDPLAGDIHGYNPDQFRDTAAQTRSFLTSAQEPAALPEAMQVSVRLRQVGRLVIAYAQKHDGRFPADLGATLEYSDDTDEHGKPLTPAERARVFLAPRDEKSVQIPEKPTRDWVNRHTSFVYYGNDAVNWNEAPRWGQTAVVSADLDREGFATEPGRPATLYPVCMIDNHVDLLPKPAAAWYASTSKETYAAIRDGAPFPDRDQAAWDLSQISAAMNRYSNKHDGHLPPDLGSLLRYVETRGPRLAKPADRARVFLSPKAERGMRVPDRPTPEWVNAHATYVYLGSADILRARIADARSTVVLHIGADEPQSVVGGDGRAGDTFPVATLEGPAPLVYGLERLRPALEQSKAILAAARGAGPLPDYYHALRDVRLITVAARAYAADHSDELPPDLGSMLDYIPANALMDPRDAERAKVFLSPKDEATSTVPARPTREWINQHASYIYLGGPGILLSRINQGPCIIVHASLKEPYQVSDLLGDFSRVPAGDIFPGASALGFGAGGDFDRVLLESRRVLDAAKKPR